MAGSEAGHGEYEDFFRLKTALETKKAGG